MSKQVIHSLVAKNGKYIVMPPWKEGQNGWGNLHHPNVIEAGGNAYALYPINTKFVDFDRTFIYGYCEGIVVTKANVGLFNHNVEETITFGATAGVVGDTTIGLVTPTTDETTADPNIFAGGMFMARTNPYGGYRVISNTGYASGVVESSGMDIVIEEPGLGAIVAANVGGCKLDRNPYTGLYGRWNGANNYETVMGVPLILAVASRYLWVQTWGPIQMGGGEHAGKAQYLRFVAFSGDGSLAGGSEVVPSGTQQYQWAGEILGNTAAATYCWLINLRLER